MLAAGAAVCLRGCRQWTLSCGVVALSVGWAAAAATDQGTGFAHWPQWRGPLGTGVAPLADPPVTWSESENFRWKVALPGVGHSSPIVWGDRIFVTSAEPYGEALAPQPDTAPGAHDNVLVTHRHQYLVLAFRRSDGELLWQKTVHRELPQEGGHYTGSQASHSPVTDGEHLFAYFGSAGLFALRLDGELVWQQDLGQMATRHGHGEGSSPALHGDTLIVNWDHEGPSALIALEKQSGEERWRVSRDEVTSWATPIIVEQAGRWQVIVSGTHRVRGHDLATGKTLWECGGLSRNIVASPVAADGMVYVGSSYDTRAMLAIRLDGATGDVTGSPHVVWSRTSGTPYVPSPLLYDDSLYFLRHYQGILTRVHAQSGVAPHGPIRLGSIGNVYASPVGASNRVYITDRDGTTEVIQHGDVPRTLAVNRLDDRFSASAAVAGKELFLRGEKFLYCLADE